MVLVLVLKFISKVVELSVKAMPVINSFQFGGAAPPPTDVILSGSVGMSLNVAGTFTTLPKGRYASASQFIQQAGSGSTRTLAFTAIPTASQSAGRIVVFQIGCYFSGGKGSISSVSYGGSACSRAIGSVSFNDKGAAEIWYVLMPTNPANDNLVINGTATITRAHVTREVLIGMTQVSPFSMDIMKKESDSGITINVSHPANGVTFLITILWKNGLSGITNLTYPQGGTTGTSFTTGSGGVDFASGSGYYAGASADSGRLFSTGWLSPSSPNQEFAGASWR